MGLYFLEFVLRIAPRSFDFRFLEPVGRPIEVEDIAEEDQNDFFRFSTIPLEIFQHALKGSGRDVVLSRRLIHEVQITDKNDHGVPPFPACHSTFTAALVVKVRSAQFVVEYLPEALRGRSGSLIGSSCYFLP
jgi:hypothetical protein